MTLLDELRDAWRSERRDHRIALLVIGAVGIALRVAHLNQPMRYDESITFLYFAELPWSRAISTYTYPNNHLFHTVLVKAATSVFGGHPWAIRLPALLAGVLVVPATYVAARVLYGARAALMATALVASSGILSLYSTNARGYSLVVLIFLLLVITAARIQRDGPTTEWVTFGILGAVGLWTIPVMLFPLGAVSLWLAIWALLEKRTADLRRLGTAMLIAFALAALAYAPVIANEGLAAVVRNPFVSPQGWMVFLHELSITLRDALRSWGLGFPPLISVALLGCAFAALAQHSRVSLAPVNLLVASYAWCAWLLVVTHRAPFSRIWLWLLPLAAALAGAGSVVMLSRWHRTASLAERRLPLLASLLALILAVGVLQSGAILRSRDTGAFTEADIAARTLRGMLSAGDRVLASIPTNGPLAFYLDRWGVDPNVLTRPESRAQRIFAVIDLEEGQTLRGVIARSAAGNSDEFVPDSTPVRFPGAAIVTFRRRNAATP